MANDLSSKIDILFNNIVEGFDATNMSAKNVSMFKPNSGSLQQAGQTFYRPMAMMVETEDGRDLSAGGQDLAELTVPSTLTDSHLRNVKFSLEGVDLNSPHIMQRTVDAATKKLSNKLDTLVADEIADQASMAVINSGDIASYEDLAEAETLMLSQQISGERVMLLNPYMSRFVAGNLASRQTMDGAPMSAYEQSMLPPIAGFNTFRTDYGKTITGSSASGYLVDGADQNTTPAAKDGNGLPQDNTYQTLTVDTGTGAAVGDVFTIGGVYAVGHINKQQTSDLKTFRITAIDGADWTISPAIIPYDGSADAQKQYANVNTTPADNAAITVLNTTTAPASVFYEKSAVEIIHADFNTDAFSATGKKVRKATTDSGVQIVMLSDSNVDTLAADYRMFIWANVKLLNPEMAGIMLANQA